MTMPMVVRMVTMAVPARPRVDTTVLRPLTYRTTLRILTKPKGRETEALVEPAGGKIVAIEPTARMASKTFQYEIHRL